MKKSVGKKDGQTVGTGSPVSMKRYIALIQKQATEDIKRHTAALAEHMEDRIIGISERFVDFDRTLNSHTEMIGTLAEDVATLTGNVATLTKDVSIIKEKVSSIEDTLKTKVDREEFAALERRVDVIGVS